MNYLSHYMIHPRGIGRTHDSVMSMIDKPDRVYVCIDENHARMVRHQYGVNTVSLPRIPEYVLGSRLVPVFDHAAIAYYLNSLEDKNEELEKENKSFREKITRVNHILEEV